jgi:heme O synthase-like polyprenyltransferase
MHTLTILGGAMATGSAGAINHFLERDLDTRMAIYATATADVLDALWDHLTITLVEK